MLRFVAGAAAFPAVAATTPPAPAAVALDVACCSAVCGWRRVDKCWLRHGCSVVRAGCTVRTFTPFGALATAAATAAALFTFGHGARSARNCGAGFRRRFAAWCTVVAAIASAASFAAALRPGFVAAFDASLGATFGAAFSTTAFAAIPAAAWSALTAALTAALAATFTTFAPATPFAAAAFAFVGRRCDGRGGRRRRHDHRHRCRCR